MTDPISSTDTAPGPPTVADPIPEPAEPAEVVKHTGPEWANSLHAGPPGHISSSPPVTDTQSAISPWDSHTAGDGKCPPTDEAANTMPDNHRPELGPESAESTEEPKEG